MKPKEMMTPKETIKMLRQDNIRLQRTLAELQASIANVVAYGIDYLNGDMVVPDGALTEEEIDEMMDETTEETGVH